MPSDLTILQVCNVGRIAGGTAACAWTVTRSLPDCAHLVAFLGRISDDTRRAFSQCRLLQWPRVIRNAVAELDPDVVLLHNTHPRHVEHPLPAVTVGYRHSTAPAAEADLTLFCSRWLAERCGGDPRRVLRQAVPTPPKPQKPTGPRAKPTGPRPAKPTGSAPWDPTCGTRQLRSHPIIGRICTPLKRKWPPDLAKLYRRLSVRFPEVRWEFVGCPAPLQTPLQEACRGKAIFLQPSWEVRSRLWHWDALLYHNPHLTESFGRTVAEAMRAGCIPIVDDRGGFREQVIDGCGFLCNSLADFAKAVEALHDQGRRWHLSHRGRAHADETFSLSRFGRELLEWFRRAACR